MPSTQEAEAPVTLAPLVILSPKSVSFCHVSIPDHSRPCSALRYQDHYYLFVRVFADRAKAQEVAKRLTTKGDAVVLTELPKGYGLWVLEPTAQPVAERQLVITSPRAVRFCHLQIPGQPKPCSGLEYGGQLYLFVRVFPDRAKAEEMAKRQIAKGNPVVLTAMFKGYGFWVLEPDAVLV